MDYGVNATLVLPSGHPFSSFQPSLYWSSTTIANGSFIAWNVGFGFGTVFFGSKSDSGFVTAVRGGS